MTAVRALLLALLVIAGFGLGGWYGWSVGSKQEAAGATPPGEDILYWSCSMHPQIQLPKFGQCPICFMDLTPVRAGEADDGGAPQLALSARARQLARVETAVVVQRELVHEIRMVGKVVPDETRITHISSYISGRLDRLFVNYTGILVRKGDHLAEIYSPELLVAQREYLLALEAVERARSQPGASEVAIATADAMLEASRRKLDLWGIPRDEIEALTRDRQANDHMRIDAPVEGWVLERMAFEGMYVETGTRIFTVADLRTVWVLLDAYELDVGYVRLGQEVEFETEAFPGESVTGRVSYIDPILNAETRTIKVRLSVPNPDLKLRPGMFARARLRVRVGEGGKVVDNPLAGKWVCYMHPEIVKDDAGSCDICGMDLVKAESVGYASEVQTAPRALAVPRTAVLLTGKRAVVYVEKQKEDRTVYEGRVVQLGPRAGDDYIVESGLSEGERVVTRAALMIDSALQIQAKPSMMQPEEAAASEPSLPSRYVADAPYHAGAAGVVDAYFELITALAAEEAERSVRAAAGLRKALTGVKPEGLEGEDAGEFIVRMRAIGNALPEAAEPSLDQLRAALPAVTRTLDTYLRMFGHQRPEPVYVVFCPMAFDDKGAAWLFPKPEVLNPYFAHRMLRCGVVREGIGPDGRERHDHHE